MVDNWVSGPMGGYPAKSGNRVYHQVLRRKPGSKVEKWHSIRNT